MIKEDVAAYWASLVVKKVVKKLPASAGDEGSIPGSGKSLGGGNGNPLVFLPGKSHGQRRLEDCSPEGHKESDTT